MDHVIDHLSDKNWRVVRQVASQIAGRKPGRKHYDFRVERKHQHRKQKSPFKDIALADRSEVQSWIRDDKHHHVQGGSLANALRHTFHVLHHTYRRDLALGGSIPFLDRIGNTLYNAGASAHAQLDVASDQFLHAVGITKERRYDATATAEDAMHARMHKDSYLHPDERKGTDGWSYMRDHSTDERAVYERDGKAMVLFRGTRPDAALNNNDLVNDLHIAAGESGSMAGLSDDKAKVTQLLDQYGDQNVNVGGYSLGGGRGLEVMRDENIYHRLGEDNHFLAPGITVAHPELADVAGMQKASFTYSHLDPVSNALAGHARDNHRILTHYGDGISGHMLLDDLSNAHPEGSA